MVIVLLLSWMRVTLVLEFQNIDIYTSLSWVLCEQAEFITRLERFKTCRCETNLKTNLLKERELLKKCAETGLILLRIRLGWTENFSLFTLLAYLCYYSRVSLHFFILMGHNVLLNLFFKPIFYTFSKKVFQFQFNKLFLNRHGKFHNTT